MWRFRRRRRRRRRKRRRRLNFINCTICKLNKLQRTTRVIMYHIEHAISKAVLNTGPIKVTWHGSNFVQRLALK
jgi:hypothetical protein